jgi:N6-L-threonylcarbamoyladenine synthase
MQNMKILAIETSCDETSIALIEKKESGKYQVLSHETISQINLHREFGGVYPTLSRREHEKNLIPLLHKVLKDSNLLQDKSQQESLESFDILILEKLGNDVELLERYPDLKENTFDFFSKYELSEQIDFIAVTNGPGLPPALWVGVNFAKVISILFSNENINIPIYPINHMEGHIIGGISERLENIVEIPKINYPAICLLISGGHTELVLSSESGKYEKIGETMDDAVGEAYDKVARLIGLPYPGGPEIGRLAKIGRSDNVEKLNFPRPMQHTKDLNFSFSGLKTHILYYIQNILVLDEKVKIQIATEFEEAVKDVLIYKTKKALEEAAANSLVVGGGVASNHYLKENFEKLTNDLGIDLYYSAKDLATDNALMIALTCANQIENGVQPTESANFIAIGSKNYEW